MTKILSLSLTLSLWLATVTSQGAVGGVGGASGVSLNDATNAARGVVTGVVTAALSAPIYIGDGDSETANGWNLAYGLDSEVYSNLPPFGISGDWFSRLMTQTNFLNHLAAFNWARGTDTATNMSNNRFATNAATSLALPGRKYYMLNIGVGDLNNGTPPNLTSNALLNMWQWARASNATVIAFTVGTNTGWSGPNAANSLILNNWIRTNTTQWDYLVDVANLLTNVATQLTSDGLHFSSLFQNQIAAWMNLNIPSGAPILSAFGLQGDRYRSSLAVSNLVTEGQALMQSIHVMENAPGFAYDGAGIELFYRTNSGSLALGGEINSIQRFTGTWTPLFLSGSDIRMQPQTVWRVMDTSGNQILWSDTSFHLTGGAGMQFGANGVTLTNIVATNSTLDFPATGGGTNADLSITWPGGCSTNDFCIVTVPASVTLPNSDFSWWLSNNTAYVRFSNYATNGLTRDPPAGLFNFLLFRR